MKKILILLIATLIIPAMAFAGDFDFSIGTTTETGLTVQNIFELKANMGDLPGYFAEEFQWSDCRPGIEIDGKLSVLNLNATCVFGKSGDEYTMSGLLSCMVAVDVFFIARVKAGVSLHYNWDSNGFIFNNGGLIEDELLYNDEQFEDYAVGVKDNYIFGNYGTSTAESLEHAQLYARAGIDFIIGAFEVGVYASVPTCACRGNDYTRFYFVEENAELSQVFSNHLTAMLRSIGVRKANNPTPDWDDTTIGISLRYSFM